MFKCKTSPEVGGMGHSVKRKEDARFLHGKGNYDINALTDMYHPCQLLADMQTYFEQRGDISGKTVAWIGDGNNMCHSYINAARQYGFTLKIACPEGYDPEAGILEAAHRAANYAELRHATDVADPERGALVAQVHERLSELGAELVWFELEWLAIDDDRANQITGMATKIES